MAGNKFRTFRRKEDSKEKKKTDIEKDSNIILKKNYEILTKAKEDEKYRAKEVLKEGTIKRVIDIIQNEDNTYIKILNESKNIRYIAVYDNKGNYVIQKYKSFQNKEEKNKHNSKIETYRSIRLCDAKIENDKNNEKDLNYFQKPNELMNKMIKFLGPEKLISTKDSKESIKNTNNLSNLYDNQGNNIEDKSDPFCVNDAFNQNNRIENNNKKEIKTDNNNKNLKLKEIKNTIEIKENESISNISEQFCSISNKFCGINTTQNSLDMNYSKKNYLVNCYLLKRELDRLEKEKNIEEKSKFEIKNLPLEPKYEKGFQVIYRPLTILCKNYFFKEYGLGHIFVRYYDKKKGMDKIIESTLEFSFFNNEIKFSDFKEEDLHIYSVIQEEELTGEEDYYEKVVDYLKKKYNKNGRLIRGSYALKDQCCFQNAEEVVTLFGKSSECIKKLHEEKILPVDKRLDAILWGLNMDEEFPYNIKFNYEEIPCNIKFKINEK